MKSREVSDPIALADRKMFLEQANQIIDLGRRVLLDRVSRGFAVRRKSDGSEVTDADVETEHALRGAIERRFPEHGIVGEEFGESRPAAEFQWILDPIDGTLSFSRGIPLYGIILALHHRGTPVVGVIDHPGLGLRYAAGRGLGATRNGLPLQLSDEGSDDDIIAVCDRAQFAKVDKTDAFDALMRSERRVRTYPDCFGHTLAVQGSVGATVDFGLKIWDLCASQVLIEEAGGTYACVHEVEKSGQKLYGVILGRERAVAAMRAHFC